MRKRGSVNHGCRCGEGTAALGGRYRGEPVATESVASKNSPMRGTASTARKKTAATYGRSRAARADIGPNLFLMSAG